MLVVFHNWPVNTSVMNSESVEVRLCCAACLDAWASLEQCQIKKVILCRGFQDIERKWKSGGMTIANRPENQVDLPVR